MIGIPAAVLERPSTPGAAYYQFNGNYPAALAASGALPVVIPLGLPEDALADLFARLDGLCLAGWVANQPGEIMPSYQENLDSLRRMLPAPLLGEVPCLQPFDVEQASRSLTLERLLGQ